MDRIYLSPPDMTDAERTALIAAFDSGWIAPVGPDLTAFEQEMWAYLNPGGSDGGGAVALSSGTAALHLALQMAGVSHGDPVWTSTMTFAATANAIRYVGATPVFIDVDPATWQLDPGLLERMLADAAESDRLPAAVVTVDLYGQACDYDRITTACDAVGVAVIEDAAEALGATYGNRRAGTFGQSAALSFNGNKLITTSGGGMLLSADLDLVGRARHLSTQARQDTLHYQHNEVGYNYRMSNLLAALGRAQLARVPDLIARRRQVREVYESAFEHVEGVQFMPIADYGEPNHWLTCLLLDPSLHPTPAEVCQHLASMGIEARPLWKPMHLQPVFDACRLVTGHPGEPIADRLFARGVCLPSGSAMSDDQQQRVVDALSGLLCA